MASSPPLSQSGRRVLLFGIVLFVALNGLIARLTRDSDYLLESRSARNQRFQVTPGYLDAALRALARQPGSKVIVVGASSVHGMRIEIEETIPAQLERLLRGARPGSEAHVLNLGIIGASAAECAWVTERAATIPAAVVVLEIHEGALDTPARFHQIGVLGGQVDTVEGTVAWPFLRKVRASVEYWGSAVLPAYRYRGVVQQLMVDRLDRARGRLPHPEGMIGGRSVPLTGLPAGPPDFPEYVKSGAQVGRNLRTFAAVAGRLSRAGRPALLYSPPLNVRWLDADSRLKGWREAHERRMTLLRAELGKTRVEYLDLSLAAPEWSCFVDITHPSPRGARKIAEALAGAILSHHLL